MNATDGSMKFPRWLSVLCVLIIVAAVGLGGFLLGKRSQPPVVTPVAELPTGVQLASQMTVLCPSYLTYADQTRIEKGTGLAGVDFLYVESKTGIDAVFLMAVAAHESAWGNNFWAKNYNNVMSLGITDSNPDRTHYTSKTANVLATAQWLIRGYLTVGAPYYHGGFTQYEIGKSYASDGSWASGVTAQINAIEAKLTETQRMKRWCVKTTLFQPDVIWDSVHTTVGWSFYKANRLPIISGRQ